MTKNKSALIIAYHFPPIAVSSGVHRMVSLANALVHADWSVTVLSAHERTFERMDPNSLSRLDGSIRVCRAQAFDTTKHLSLKGKYFQFMALPDNLQSWIIFGVIRGLWEIQRSRPSLILSTYPLASAHVIAIILHKLTGIPWIADFRDPMAQEGYPADPLKWKMFKWIEESAARYAVCMTFATPGALAEYQERYPAVPTERWQLVTNGYIEEQFIGIQSQSRDDDEIRILHSGLIYIHERNPRPLFQALACLRQANFFQSRKVRFILRAAGHEQVYTSWLNELGITSLVELAPAIPYREALQEMFDVDGLLLLQGAGCNQQIPAKAYEYLRVQKPILALTDESGDTAALLRENGCECISPLDDENRISEELVRYIEEIERRDFKGRDMQSFSDFERSIISSRWVSKLGEIA